MQKQLEQSEHRVHIQFISSSQRADSVRALIDICLFYTPDQQLTDGKTIRYCFLSDKNGIKPNKHKELTTF
jgi:hypothetical protein